jgi:hypothetical protein
MQEAYDRMWKPQWEFESVRYHAAIHESARAFIADDGGLHVEWVTLYLDPEEPISAGSLITSMDASDRSLRTTRARILSCMAGEVAIQQLIPERHQKYHPAAHPDYGKECREIVQKLLDGLNLARDARQKMEQELREEVTERVQDYAEVIRSLADTLVRIGSIGSNPSGEPLSPSCREFLRSNAEDFIYHLYKLYRPWGADNLGAFICYMKEAGLPYHSYSVFIRMTEAEWKTWEPRYHALIATGANHRPVVNADKTLTPPAEWWETEFYKSFLMLFANQYKKTQPQQKQEDDTPDLNGKDPEPMVN